MEALDVMLKRFEEPDEARTFEKGKVELVRIGGMKHWSRHLPARMEMVRSRRPERRGSLQR